MIVCLYPKGYNMALNTFIKEKRMAAGLTQPDMARKAGVGLRFVREMEQGKETLRMDAVNQVLKLFGFELGPVKIDRNNLLEDGEAHASAKSNKKQA